MVEREPMSDRLPDDIPPPEVFGRGTWPVVTLDLGREAGSPASGFAGWAARQYSQVLAPIHFALQGASRVSVAARANLSRNAVQATLDGASWPQFQTLVRLAHVAGIELFSLTGRDLVEHGPPLPPDEQALLLAYRRLPNEARTRLREQAIRVVAERQRQEAARMVAPVTSAVRNGRMAGSGSQAAAVTGRPPGRVPVGREP